MLGWGRFSQGYLVGHYENPPGHEKLPSFGLIHYTHLHVGRYVLLRRHERKDPGPDLHTRMKYISVI